MIVKNISNGTSWNNIFMVFNLVQLFYSILNGKIVHDDHNIFKTFRFELS